MSGGDWVQTLRDLASPLAVLAIVALSWLAYTRAQARTSAQVAHDLRESNLELRRSRAMLARAQRIAQLGHWEQDLASGRLTWSAPMFDILGLARPSDGDAAGEYLDCVHPDDRTQAREFLRACAAGDAPAEVEHRIVRPSDGAERYVVQRVELVRDASGAPRSLVGTIQDITERKIANAELRRALARIEESEARYRALFERMPIPMWVFDRSTLRFIAVNDAAVEHYGYTREEFLGMNLADIRPAGETERLREFIAQHDSGLVNAGVWHHRLKDGAIIEVEIASHDIDFSGRAARIVLAKDVTEQVRTRRVLEERDRFFAMSAELFCIADTHGRFRQVNAAFSRVLGYPEKLLLSTPWIDFVHPADRAASVLEGAKVAEQSTASSFFSNRYRCADGSYRWLDWNSTLSRDGLIYSVARDVTDRKHAEAELERAFHDLSLRNEELQSFAYVASHDLQEPLRKIQAFGDRLRERCRGALDEQGHDYIERMTNAAARMQVLIGDLLDYSRITTRGRPFASVDLNAVLRGVLSDLETAIEQAQAQVVAGSLPTIEADPMQMRQLLQNLIANSIKFRAPERIPVIHVSGGLLRDARGGVEGQNAEGARCRIDVSDNGIGFDNQYRERIFVPFQRLHGRSEYPGNGIGLAIVRKIVERHGGSIQADGKPGEGTSFCVELPVKQG